MVRRWNLITPSDMTKGNTPLAQRIWPSIHLSHTLYLEALTIVHQGVRISILGMKLNYIRLKLLS